MRRTIGRALLSVYDKQGLAEFARGLDVARREPRRWKVQFAMPALEFAMPASSAAGAER